MLDIKEIKDKDLDIHLLEKKYGRDVEVKMSIAEFHNICFPNKHLNSTRRKICLLQDELAEEQLIELRKIKVHLLKTVLKPVEVYHKIKKIKLL